MSMLRLACKSCLALQRNLNPDQGSTIFRVLNRQPYFKRYLTITTCTSNSNRPTPVEKKSELSELTTADNESFSLDPIIADENVDLWESVEADITDLTTFNLLKEQYNSRVQEMDEKTTAQTKQNGEATIVAPIKSKRNFRKKPVHVKKQGDQLTYQSEQNVLAEIDIYTFLKMPTNAINLFNYHRRHGHKFSLDAYNKVIHIWASQGSWRSVQMLLKNLTKEGLEPNYQTYAGLLETCGNIKDQRKTEKILFEMELKGFKVKEVFNQSILTANQISSVVRAVGKIHPNIVEEYQLNQTVRNFGERETTVDLLRDANVFKLISEQKEKELTGYVKMKSIDTTKMNDKKTKKRADQYKGITQK
ncbi:uncharacterized protein [Clytia hemisphaerica]|uniref:Uncharacterized protein n=1 Tax=Clytia hemisphaerica TaxID=252671 RepID=A0A7M5TYA1_9CNID